MRGWLVAAVLVVGCGSHEEYRVPIPPEPVPQPIVLPEAPVVPFAVAAPTDKIVALGRGDRHACVVRASGAVDCWGQHARATCKDCFVPAPADSTIRRVPDMTDAVAISRDARCVLRRTGDLACLDTDKLAFVRVDGIANATLADGACGLVGTSVRCFDEESRKVSEVANLPDVVMLRTTRINGCLVRKSGDVWCGYVGDKWGRIRGLDHVVDLAVSSAWYADVCVASKQETRCLDVDFSGHTGDKIALVPPLAGARDLAMHFELEGRFALSGIVDGKVVEVELTSEAAVQGTHTVDELTDAVQSVFGCALRAQGSVVCWGSNDGGVLAQRTTIGSVHLPPTAVVGLTDIADIALGTTEVYALSRAGQLLHWGARRRWEADARAEEVPLGLGPSLLVQIEALPTEQLCMRSAAGLVWCQQDEWTRAIVQVDTSDVQRIVGGYGAMFAVRANGYLERHGLSVRWGLDPELMQATNVVDVAPDYDSQCLLRRDGSVRCGRPLPQLQGATRIIRTGSQVCGLRAGHIVCVDRRMNTSREIPGIVDATDLATADEYACAVHGGGRVTCWHVDENGEIAKVEDVLKSGATRVKLGGGREAQIQEAATMTDTDGPGGELGCAVMIDRTVTCWGTNLNGELGDGSFVASEKPIGVAL